MCAFTVLLYLVLIVSSSLHSLGRRVSHSPLRSITNAPVQSIDFHLGQYYTGLVLWAKLVEWKFTVERWRAYILQLSEISKELSFICILYVELELKLMELGYKERWKCCECISTVCSVLC